MQRRDVLTAVAGTAAAASATGLAGVGSARRQADNGGYEPLASIDLAGTRELVTNEDGSVAYVAVDDGVATVDLSEPSSPTVLAERRDLLADVENGPLQLLWDVWPDGDRLLAVAQANGVDPETDLHAALLFDVADPADPQLLDHVQTEFPIHNAFFGDGVAYLTANGLRGNPLVLLDAEDDELAEVGRWSLLDRDERWEDANSAVRQLHDVYVQDDVAYLAYWDAGTYLLDVSDPSEPTYLGHTAQRDREELTSLGPIGSTFEAQTPPGNDHYAQVDENGELLAVGREAWTAVNNGECEVGGAGGIDLYDVGDPSSIEHYATIEPPESYDQSRGGPFTTSHNFDLVDGRLYSSWYFGGVKLHDVSDPANPEELAWWRSPSETAFWTARSAVADEYFVASSAADAGGMRDGVPGRVYVFPDEPGEQADPPSLTDQPDDYEPLPRCEDVENGAGDGSGGAGDDGGGDAGDADTADEDESDAVPGFGVGGAIAGLGLSAGWMRARTRSPATGEDGAD